MIIKMDIIMYFLAEKARKSRLNFKHASVLVNNRVLSTNTLSTNTENCHSEINTFKKHREKGGSNNHQNLG